MEYKRIKDKILIRLAKGDEIISSLYQVIEKEDIKSAWLNGIGAFKKVILGAYRLELKDYKKTSFEGHYEIISLVGNVSLNDNSPFLHMHISMSDENCKSFGGHLFSGIITATCEIIMHINHFKVDRKIDDNIGLCLWTLDV